MFINTEKQLFRKALSSNATDSSFASRTPTTTEPSGSGVLDVLGNSAVVAPFGTDAGDEAFDLRVIGWRQAGDLWIPTPLVQVTCTLGTTAGVSGELVTDSDLFADTLSSFAGYSARDAYGPADNTIASFVIDVLGCKKIEVQVDVDSAASGNALVAFL